MGVLRIILEDVVTDMKMRKIFVNETSPIIVQKHAHCYGVFKKIQFYEGTVPPSVSFTSSLSLKKSNEKNQFSCGHRLA